MTRSCFLLLCGATLGLGACDTSNPTEAVLHNGYPAGDSTSAASPTVYKAWWSVAEFRDPVLAGEESAPVRVVEGEDFAYALLAPGWDPASGTTPERLVPVRTIDRPSVTRGDTLRIVVSDTTTLGDCAKSSPLEQADADFITQRIFQGEFVGQRYDAATCTASSVSEAGAPSETGGGGATDGVAGARD